MPNTLLDQKLFQLSTFCGKGIVEEDGDYLLIDAWPGQNGAIYRVLKEFVTVNLTGKQVASGLNTYHEAEICLKRGCPAVRMEAVLLDAVPSSNKGQADSGGGGGGGHEPREPREPSPDPSPSRDPFAPPGHLGNQ